MTIVDVSTTPPPRRRRRWLVPLVVVVLLAGAGSAAYALWPRDITIVGSVSIPLARTEVVGSACLGTGGYSDIRAGAQVVLTDASDETLALGRLSPGDGRGTLCTFRFSISAPAGQDFYRITIASRNTLTYAESDLINPITLSLGD